MARTSQWRFAAPHPICTDPLQLILQQLVDADVKWLQLKRHAAWSYHEMGVDIPQELLHCVEQVTSEHFQDRNRGQV